jgi:hypothetical protein
MRFSRAVIFPPSSGSVSPPRQIFNSDGAVHSDPPGMPKTSPKNIIAVMNVLIVFLAIIGDDVSAIICRSSEC